MMELMVLNTQSMLNKVRSLEFELKAGDSMSLVGFLLCYGSPREQDSYHIEVASLRWLAYGSMFLASVIM